jgi:hypothetical protein
MEEDALAFMRTLRRVDYRREADIAGKSLGAALAESVSASDEPPPEEGWHPPGGEEPWAALTLRQRLAAVYRSQDREPVEIAEKLHLRIELILRWERLPMFRRAVAQRRLHRLRDSSVAALRDRYEADRAIRSRMVGFVEPAAAEQQEGVAE